MNSETGLWILGIINLIGIIYLLKRRRSVKRVKYIGGIAWYDLNDNLINSTTKI